jgi:hypothetical protein
MCSKPFHDFFVPSRLQRDRSRQAVHISRASVFQQSPARAVIAPSAMLRLCRK